MNSRGKSIAPWNIRDFVERTKNAKTEISEVARLFFLVRLRERIVDDTEI